MHPIGTPSFENRKWIIINLTLVRKGNVVSDVSTQINCSNAQLAVSAYCDRYGVSDGAELLVVDDRGDVQPVTVKPIQKYDIEWKKCLGR